MLPIDITLTYINYDVGLGKNKKGKGISLEFDCPREDPRECIIIKRRQTEGGYVTSANQTHYGGISPVMELI